MFKRRITNHSPGFIVFLIVVLGLAMFMIVKCAPERVAAEAVEALKE
jgi:hypothetical protein